MSVIKTDLGKTMKVHICRPESTEIQNYFRIEYSDNLDLSDLMDNSCEEILCDNILDDFAYADHQDLLSALSSKLRLNGLLILNATEPRLVCLSVVKGMMTEEEFNQFLFKHKSSVSMKTIKEKVVAANLHIETANYEGNQYEIRIRRNQAGR